MIHQKLEENLSQLQFELPLIKEITSLGRLKRVEEGALLIAHNSNVSEIPLVLEGTLKVSRKEDHDSEILLYFLGGGEICAMSVACCLEISTQPVVVTAEEDATLWMIPMGLVDQWIVKYPSFRKFVFRSYQFRFNEMLTTIDSIAFLKMDDRLYKYLLDKKQASGTYIINKTHEQIAREMNSSRVVISRLLKQLERQGKIEQYRNRVEVL